MSSQKGFFFLFSLFFPFDLPSFFILFFLFLFLFFEGRRCLCRVVCDSTQETAVLPISPQSTFNVFHTKVSVVVVVLVVVMVLYEE